jgi:hypothetical protein
MTAIQQNNGDSPDMKEVLNEAVSDTVEHWNSATRAITTSATQGACFVISMAKLFALVIACGLEKAEEWIQLDDPTTETAIRRRLQLAQEPALAIVGGSTGNLNHDHKYSLQHATSDVKGDTRAVPNKPPGWHSLPARVFTSSTQHRR